MDQPRKQPRISLLEELVQKERHKFQKNRYTPSMTQIEEEIRNNAIEAFANIFGVTTKARLRRLALLALGKTYRSKIYNVQEIGELLTAKGLATDIEDGILKINPHISFFGEKQIVGSQIYLFTEDLEMAIRKHHNSLYFYRLTNKDGGIRYQLRTERRIDFYSLEDLYLQNEQTGV